MGVSVYYWAIPASGALLHKLRSEAACALLMARLFHYNRGIFYLFDESDQVDDDPVVGDIVDSGVLGPEAEARRHIDAFKAAVNETRTQFPGIEDRQALLEKTYELVEEVLARALRPSLGEGFGSFLHDALWGDEELGRNLGLEETDILGIITSPFVRSAANVLGGLDAESLFASADDEGRSRGAREDFERWRELYRAAAQHGDVLLVGVC